MAGGSAAGRPKARQLWRTVWTAMLAGLMLLPGGCVRRRLHVRSNPSGALVYVDNQRIGTTPCSVDFTYYGTREIRLVKPGYETLTVNQPIPTPWYQVPPLDFISENLTPKKIRDHRTVSFNLAPQLVVPTEQLLDRASELRQQMQQYPVAPATGTAPIGVAPPPTIAVPPQGVMAPPSTAPAATAPPFTPPPIVGPPPP